ncbi:hypothetical protein KY317_02510 [Candidatus Woesearchaeota archaeon]|nr:hypothetical protein [Candidatus Woesearchaeota archaeon]
MRKILLLCIIAIGVMFLLNGCKVQEEEAAEAAEAAEEAAAEEAVKPMPTKIFSDLACIDGNIEVTVYNIEEAGTMEIGKDITFIINGLVTNPEFFECTALELEAGTSATCTITPVKALRAENTVQISEKVSGKVVTETELLVCSTAAAE